MRTLAADLLACADALDHADAQLNSHPEPPDLSRTGDAPASWIDLYVARLRLLHRAGLLINAAAQRYELPAEVARVVAYLSQPNDDAGGVARCPANVVPMLIRFLPALVCTPTDVSTTMTLTPTRDHVGDAVAALCGDDRAGRWRLGDVCRWVAGYLLAPEPTKRKRKARGNLKDNIGTALFRLKAGATPAAIADELGIDVSTLWKNPFFKQAAHTFLQAPPPAKGYRNRDGEPVPFQ